MKAKVFLRTYIYIISGSLQTPPPPAFEYFVTSFTVAHGGVEDPQITIGLRPAQQMLKTPLLVRRVVLLHVSVTFHGYFILHCLSRDDDNPCRVN